MHAEPFALGVCPTLARVSERIHTQRRAISGRRVERCGLRYRYGERDAESVDTLCAFG